MRFSPILLLTVLLLAGCAGGPARDLSHAPEGTQSIRFWHKPSGERIEVAYRMGGRYSEQGFAEIDHMFRDRHTGEQYRIDPELIELIAGLRDRMAMPPDTEIELLSGYRSQGTNAMLARTNRHVAKDSYHMKGMAADIRIPGMIPSVLEWVAKTQQKGGVALYPDSGHVHVDTGPVRGWSVERGFERGLSRRRGGCCSEKEPLTTRPGKPVRAEDAAPVTMREQAPEVRKNLKEGWRKTMKPAPKTAAGKKPSDKKTKETKPPGKKPAATSKPVKKAPPKAVEKTGKAKKPAVRKPPENNTPAPAAAEPSNEPSQMPATQ